MAFRIGVEEEYQLVDPVTGALRSRARDVLRGDWSDEIREEFHETTIEIGTRICSGAEDIDVELRRLRFQVGTAAAAEGLEIAAAGTHPFSPWESQLRTAGERYGAIARRYGRIVRDEHIFGMHVHVEVPRERRVELLSACRVWLPHLLVLSCSSPFLEGEDTGFDSFRSIMWRRWPLSGVPPHLGSESDYRALIDTLLTAGAIEDERTVYWSLRPHPVYPTLEFRVMDVCPRLEDAVSIAALIRSLVVAAAEGRLPAAGDGALSAALREEVLRANFWLAARYGLAANFIVPDAATGHVVAADALRRLLDGLLPVAESLGDAAALAGIERLLDRGNGARRMRAVREERGSDAELMRWLIGETMLGSGLDRRGGQRETISAR
jgi:glutamate---cysteine ligase / carboxylate-amine ligase